MKELKSAFQELQSRFPRFRAEVAMRKCDKNGDGYIEFGKESESVVSYAEECHYTVPQSLDLYGACCINYEVCRQCYICIYEGVNLKATFFYVIQKRGDFCSP